MAADPLVLGNLAESLLNTAVAALQAMGRPVDRTYVAHGAPAWDLCKTDQVTVHVSPLGMRSDRCNVQLQPVLHVQLVRCVPIVGNDGAPPTAGELHLSGRALTDDMVAVVYAVTAAQLFGPCQSVSYGPVQDLGPIGGVAGWDWPITTTL